MREQATAFAPATVANVAVGFDVLGFAIDGIGDRATVTRTHRKGRIEMEKVEGGSGDIPLDPAGNTATAGLLQLVRDLNLPFGLSVRIEKGIPLGSGMGGSAASAVAAAFATNALLETPLSENELTKYALIGEAVASGSKHGDNIAPCLLGGLVMVTSVEPPSLIRIPVPNGLYSVVVHPPIRVETKTARSILKPTLPLKAHIEQSAQLGAFIAGCFRADVDLIGRSLRDTVIEPQRAHLIQGFAEVQRAALQAGALGCSISGAGPAIFALARDKARAEAIAQAMVQAFADAGVPRARAWVSALPARGARLEER